MHRALEHIGACSGDGGVGLIVRCFVDGQHDHLRFWRNSVDLPRGFNPIHLRQPDVHQHNVWWLNAGKSDCLFTAFRFQKVTMRKDTTKPFAQCCSDCFVVFNDQNS